MRAANSSLMFGAKYLYQTRKKKEANENRARPGVFSELEFQRIEADVRQREELGPTDPVLVVPHGDGETDPQSGTTDIWDVVVYTGPDIDVFESVGHGEVVEENPSLLMYDAVIDGAPFLDAPISAN